MGDGGPAAEEAAEGDGTPTDATTDPALEGGTPPAGAAPAEAPAAAPAAAPADTAPAGTAPAPTDPAPAAPEADYRHLSDGGGTRVPCVAERPFNARRRENERTLLPTERLKL